MVSERQLNLEELLRAVEKQPEPWDLKDLIRQEHERAELQRLRAGYAGCGCADCQSFYETLDLPVFGGRVLRTGGVINIGAGKAGADLWDKYNQPDYWLNDMVQSVSGWCWTSWLVKDDFKPVCLGTEPDVKQALATGTIPESITGKSRQILGEIIELERNKDNGKSDADNFKAIRVCRQRSRPAKDFEHRAGYVKRAAAGKILPGGKA